MPFAFFVVGTLRSHVWQHMKKDKTGKQTSSVWKYMQKGLDSTFCLICEKKFSLNSATTCLYKHLETKHGLDLKAGKDKPSPNSERNFSN